MDRLATLLRVTHCIDRPKVNTYHSGAYLTGNWTWYELCYYGYCELHMYYFTSCGNLAEASSGCKPISL